MVNEMVTGLIAGVVASIISIYISVQAGSSELDKSSEWRRSLLDVASTYEIGLNEAQRVRASIRFLKHSEIDNELLKYSFDWMTNHMIEFFEITLSESFKNNRLKDSKRTMKQTVTNEKNNDKILYRKEQDIVRLFANFLLKYHFIICKFPFKISF